MKRLCVILTAVLLLTLVPTMVFAAPSIEENAEDLSLGVATSYISDSDNPADFKVVIDSKNTLQITLNTKCNETEIYLYDADGNSIEPYGATAKTGTASHGLGSKGSDRSGTLKKDSTFKKGSGTFSYNLNKGTYYIRLYNYDWWDADSSVFEATVLAKVKTATNTAANETSKNPSTYVAIPLKQGKEIQLSAVILNSTNKTVTWKSNNTQIATVSSDGLVKAVGVGSTYITLKANDQTDYIYIQVTK